MINFRAMHQNMINGQLLPNEIQDVTLLRTFEEIPREMFVPPSMGSLAYADLPIPLGFADRFLLPALTFGKLVQMAKIQSYEKVLDIGCGFGYSSLILSFLAKQVIGLESDLQSVERAREKLAAFEIVNLHFEVGDLREGWAPKEPYDLLFFEGITQEIPETLITQLAPQGRIVTLEKQNEQGPTQGVLYSKSEGMLTRSVFFEASGTYLREFMKRESFVFP